NTATSATNNVVLSISTGTGATGATLSGITTVAASGGVATFSGLSIDKVANGYQLAAQSGTLTPATTATFNITIGGPAQLVFSVQPGGSITGGVAFPTQPVVTVSDAGGNAVTGSAVSITMAIKAATGVAGATLSGTSTVATNTGTGAATFSGLSIDKAPSST